MTSTGRVPAGDDRRARHSERLPAVARERRELEDFRELGLDIGNRKRHSPIFDRDQLLCSMQASDGRELRDFDAQQIGDLRVASRIEGRRYTVVCCAQALRDHVDSFGIRPVPVVTADVADEQVRCDEAEKTERQHEHANGGMKPMPREAP